MKRDLLAPSVRQRLVRLPPPHDSDYGVVPLPPPEGHVDLRSLGRRHERAVAALARADALVAGLHSPYLATRILLRQEAVSSSLIEGTQSTLDELLLVEESADGDEREAARQVRDYATVLEDLIPRAREEGPAIFTLDLVKLLHARVMAEDRGFADEPGALRQIVNWIGGIHINTSTWNPPPPDKVAGCLEETLDYMRNEGMQQMHQSFITRIAVAHAHFEAVHPFRDGNGRVGRMLIPLAMAAEGHTPIYLSPFIERNRYAYYEALREAQQRLNWPAIVGFVSDAIVSSVEHLERALSELDALRTLWMSRRKYRANSAALRALEVLISYPVLTAERLSERLSVTFAQASNALAQLEEAGVVRRKGDARRYRLFVAEEVLRILNG